jgi:tetratricopeptide (TPR) repeat protein
MNPLIMEALMTSVSQVPAPVPSVSVLISYVGPDLMWAEWITEQLQRAGAIVEMAEWTGDPGDQLTTALQTAAARYGRCVAVMSSSYLRAVVPDAETGEATAAWAAEHPGVLTPVLVRRCDLPSRFWQLDPVDLRETTSDQVAAKRLLNRVLGVRVPFAHGGETEPMTRFPGRRPPVWASQMPPRNPYFTGRDEMLRELRRRLTTDVTALLPHSLQGLSGVGKTQLAIEYAYRFSADYDIVWWIPAEARAGTRQCLAELAIRLDLGGSTAQTGELIRAALDALRTGQPYQRWLLIFDNAGAPEELQPLPSGPGGHILITSRDHAWGSQADVLDVDVYSRAESTEFLQRRTRALSPADANRLADELGDLPLALEHAAGWLTSTGMSAEDYLSLFREHTAELFDPAMPKDYTASVRVTWTISMNQLRGQNPDAEDLLNLCAFIGPDPIPLRLLTAGPPESLPAALREALESPFKRAAILRDIGSYSLARIGEATGGGTFEGPSLQQHRLVQAVVRDVASAGERATYRRMAHQILAAADPGDPEIPANWRGYAALLPHLLSSGAVTNTDQNVRALVLHEARALWRRGEFRTCLTLVNDAAKAWSGTLDDEDPDFFLASRERSNAMHGLGMFAESLAADLPVYESLSARLGPDHPATARAAGLLALDYRRMGHFAPARELDDHALAVAVRDHGRDDPETSRLAHNVAVNHRMAGEFTAALEIDRYNARVLPEVLGPDSFQAMFAINNVARDLRELGQYYEALSLQEITFSRYREVYGPDNPETLRAMKNLAVSRRKAGRYAEAAELATEVLGRHLRKFGELHPETLAGQTNLANDCRCTGEYAAGRGLADAALRGFRQVFGDDHPFAACAAVNLAALMRVTGDIEPARQANEDALERLRASFGREHRYTLSCAVNLASDLATAGEPEAARQLDEQTLTALRRVSGEDHPYTLSCAVNLALDLRAVGEREAFRELYTDTMERYHRTLGNGHPEAQAAAARERAICDIEPPPV